MFKNGKFHHTGILYYPNGVRYEGEFSKGIKKGKGRLINNNEQIIYEGIFKDNKKQGNGTFL